MANTLINGPQGESASPAAPAQPDTAVWMYRAGEEKLFASITDVPTGEGWVDSPAAVKPAEPPKKAKKASDGDSDRNQPEGA